MFVFESFFQVRAEYFFRRVGIWDFLDFRCVCGFVARTPLSANHVRSENPSALHLLYTVLLRAFSLFLSTSTRYAGPSTAMTEGSSAQHVNQ
jgi:hypothetical protein